MFVFLKRERLVQSVPMVEIIPDRPDALMKMISCFSVHHRWWVSQILASNLPSVKHFYHALHIVILDKYELYIQKQEIISIDGIHIKLPIIARLSRIRIFSRTLT
jgi:hypothetical protein